MSTTSDDSVKEWGELLVSGGGHKSLNYWHAYSGTRRHVREGAHGRCIWDVQHIGDGCIASGSNDRTIKLWDLTVSTQQHLRTLTGHKSNVHGLAVLHRTFNPLSPSPQHTSAQHAFSSSSSTTSTTTPTTSSSLPSSGGSPGSGSGSPGPLRLCSGSQDKTLKIWNVATSRCVSTLEGHVDAIYGVFSIISPNHPCLVVSGSDDKTSRIWDVERETCVSVLDGHQNTVLQFEYAPTTDWLFSVSDDKKCKVWDLRTVRIGSSASGSGSGASTGATDPGSADGSMCVHTLTHVTFVKSVHLVTGSNLCVMTGDRLGNVSTWDLRAPDEPVAVHQVHTNRIRRIISVVGPNGETGTTFASGAEDCSIKLWKNHGKTILQEMREEKTVWALTFLGSIREHRGVHFLTEEYLKDEEERVAFLLDLENGLYDCEIRMPSSNEQGVGFAEGTGELRELMTPTGSASAGVAGDGRRRSQRRRHHQKSHSHVDGPSSTPLVGSTSDDSPYTELLLTWWSFVGEDVPEADFEEYQDGEDDYDDQQDSQSVGGGGRGGGGSGGVSSSGDHESSDRDGQRKKPKRKHVIELPWKVRVDQDVFSRMMLGLNVQIPHDRLLDYYLVMKALGSKMRMYVVCRQLANVQSMSTLLSLFKTASRLFEPPPQDDDYSDLSDDFIDDDEQSDDPPPIRFISPFCLAIFNEFKTRFTEIESNRKLFRRFEHAHLLGKLRDFEVQNVAEHQRLQLRLMPRTFFEVTHWELQQLYKRKSKTNLMLVTKDGRRFNVHREILLWRSNFFFRMVRYGGSEVREMERGEISITMDLGGNELEALLQFLYMNQISFQDDLAELMKLLSFCEIYREIPLRFRLIPKIRDISRRQIEDGSFEQSLTRFGYLLKNPQIAELFEDFWLSIGQSEERLASLIHKSTEKVELFETLEGQGEMIKAVQKTASENQREITALREENQELKARVAALEEMIRSLPQFSSTTDGAEN